MNITAQDAAKQMSAAIIGDTSTAMITNISTDSRSVKPGDCFIALKGEAFDGHDYAETAFGGGASSLVVERELPGITVVQFVVPDTLKALGDLAQLWRLRLAGIPLVAVVGSSGKTTTKEMAAEIVGGSKNLLATRGNLNNLIGAPQMLARLTPQHEAAILELGMNVPGELKRLTEITVPDGVCLVNITNAHIGMFGSQEALYLAKTDAIRNAPQSCVLIINADDPLSARAAKEYGEGRTTLRFGAGEEIGLTGSIQPIRPFGYQFDLRMPRQSPQRVSLRVFGRHNISNALAAAAIAHFFGISAEEIATRLSGYTGRANRSEVEIINGWHLIKDYYNASPAAVEAALRSMADFEIPGRRFAVLGDMMELGEMEEPLHRRIGEIAAESGLSCLFTVGDRGKLISDAAGRSGANVEHLPSAGAVAARLRAELCPGDLVLIKGSRLMKLEQVYDLLKG